ncbi:MAG TPA: hypothetical protein VGK90_09620 [Rhizomicrobium sp.]|jgi:hypothetical protein
MQKLQTLGMAVLLVSGAALCATSAMAASDNFNRAALGKKWVVTSGTLEINNDEMQGSNEGLGYFKKSKKNTAVSATVIATNTDLEYGAVVSGDIASGNNAFVKIQGESDGAFQDGGFYTGNNGGGDFFGLSSEVPSPAKISVEFCGTVATLTIKSSAPTQKYTYDYGTTFGGGGGLGTYGSVALDNYKSSNKTSCAPDKDAIRITHSDRVDPTLKK